MTAPPAKPPLIQIAATVTMGTERPFAFIVAESASSPKQTQRPEKSLRSMWHFSCANKYALMRVCLLLLSRHLITDALAVYRQRASELL